MTLCSTIIKDRATPPGAIEPAETLRQEVVSASVAYGCNNYSEILVKDCVRADFAHSNVSQEEVRLFHEIINREQI